ncbi:hypothetical protein GN109_01455 [Collimonas pratensis]|uniref:HNH endonuclease n=1 Tax=Collimonas pratensis TaxID=279113 RepID=UPI00143D452D|nr:HNH endonuclease [Collimonas pratensis]NKI68071.1 hypothetical protein [Collimonas pratensis]
MRNFPPRPPLGPAALRRLTEKTNAILASPTPQALAESCYTNSRRTRWFVTSVVAALTTMVGLGGRCMFCGSSEASQVDHFMPKAVYPAQTMVWENFIWICGLCNQHKGNEFPCDAQGNSLLINPIDDDVWLFFTIDKLGFILPVWNMAADDIDIRAHTTETLYKFNRQAVQESRQKRIQSLCDHIADCVLLHSHGHLTVQQKQERIDKWLLEPFHPEVAQYFFRGPGRTEEPFATYLNLI